MEKTIDISEVVIILAVFGAAMILLVLWLSRKDSHSSESFLVADRNINWFHAALSIAVSWVWAPAIFIASLQAYTKGIAGAFWFIVPNVVCFFIFTPVALKLRQNFPEGYTLPQFILKRYDGDKRTHLAFLTIVFGYQLSAIIINALAGGTLLHVMTGINVNLAIILISAIAFIYSVISGLRASVSTDIVQMAFILVVAGTLIPWAVSASGGMDTLVAGFGGLSGEFGSILHPGVAYSFGIAMTMSLIAGPICDQMFWQRTFAVRQRDIVKTFVVGGLIFAAVPLLLCLPGFIAASPTVAQTLVVANPEMVAPMVFAEFLPKWALMLFVLMAVCGLCSTLDSAYCAMSGLGGIDIYRRYIAPSAQDKQILRAARFTMFAMAVLGTAIALLKPQLIWLFLIYGALASTGVVPIVCSIFWKDLSKETAYWAIVLSMMCTLPLSIYANVFQNTDLIVLSSISGPLLGLIICSVSRRFGTSKKSTVY